MSRCEPDKQKNRTDFPHTAKTLDFFRSLFGDDVKLLYAVENGNNIGRKPKSSTHFIGPTQWLAASARLVNSECYADIRSRLLSASKSNNPKRGRA